jgi:chromosomal replication initiator protein
MKPRKRTITVEKIQFIVSDVTKIPPVIFLAPDGSLRAREPDRVIARQLSIIFSREYTKLSETAIGEKHGGRTHATVIHAIKAVSNALDTGYVPISEPYRKIERKIKDHIIRIDRTSLIKTWIRNRVPLAKREEMLLQIA